MTASRKSSPAVTRGKKLVVLVGTKKALGMAVRRQDTAKRFTALRGRLGGARESSNVVE